MGGTGDVMEGWPLCIGRSSILGSDDDDDDDEEEEEEEEI